MPKIGIGLFGMNGHQIQGRLAEHARAELVAYAGFAPEKLPVSLQQAEGIRQHETLDALLSDDRVELVSLCSPRRRDQAAQAIQCLDAGKHVYAEKPCAMTEPELDAILAAAERTGKRFHEMAGTALHQPFQAMAACVREGTIGDVVQVLAQKSYPYHDRRPQDEDVDGGLLMQAGVHALRFIEHVAGTPVARIQGQETGFGNPGAGDLRMASSMMMTLENGGLAVAIANYLNPRAFGSWGNETLRIFGTKGFVEAVDGGTRTRLVLADEDRGPLALEAPSVDYFDLISVSLQGEATMPFTPEVEVHPTRMVIRAKASVG